jgi:hypothetical protein
MLLQLEDAEVARCVACVGRRHVNTTLQSNTARSETACVGGDVGNGFVRLRKHFAVGVGKDGDESSCLYRKWTKSATRSP